MDTTSPSSSPASGVFPWSKIVVQITTPQYKYSRSGDASTDSKLETVSAPLPRAYHSSSAAPSASGDILIFGGAVGLQPRNDIWAIKLSGDSGSTPGQEEVPEYVEVIASLVEATGETPSPRVGHRCVLGDESLIVWGGITSVDGPDDSAVYSLNVNTYTWSKLDIQPAPSPRALHATCMCKDKLIVFGGATSGNQLLNDLWSFDSSARAPKWELIEASPRNRPPPVRGGHIMFVYENKLYMFGGSDDKTLYNDTWCFDMSTHLWTELRFTGSIPPPRTYHAVALVGDAAYIFGGCGEGWKELGDTWSFKINEQKWHWISSINPKRSHHTLASVRNHIVVLGGEEDLSQSGGTTFVDILDTSEFVPIELSVKPTDENMCRLVCSGLIGYPENREINSLSPIEPPPSGTFTDILSGETVAEEEHSKDTISAERDLTSKALETKSPTPGAITPIIDEPDLAIDNLEPGSHGARSAQKSGFLTPGAEASQHPSQYTITGAMPTTKIFRNLVIHGCRDVSEALDISRVSEYPVSSGGFGDVYCATLRNGDRVALKCLRMLVGSTEEGQKFLKRAAHELYVWSKCTHPNVLELSGIMLFRDRIAMVSPWVENGHLRWFLSRGPQVDRCVLAGQIADGVDYLHEQGIVHGDLKPENVLITRDQIPKLTDFGNAALAEYTLQFTNSSTTQSMSVRWTAPEILKQETKTTKAGDIFALGMIIFETVTGLLPYAGISDPVAMFSIAAGKLPERSEEHIPSGVEQADQLWSAITRCWAYDPNERPKAHEVRSMMNGITSKGLLAKPS